MLKGFGLEELGIAAGYLGQIICAQIENWIEIRVALAVEEGDLTRIL